MSPLITRANVSADRVKIKNLASDLGFDIDASIKDEKTTKETDVARTTVDLLNTAWPGLSNA